MDVLANALTFMATPAFAITWFALSVVTMAAVVIDILTVNTALNGPLKVVWPIIIFFFSLPGGLLYLAASRPLDLARYPEGMARKQRFTEFSRPRWRKVVGSATHCVGGDGLGIMTAMVLARVLKFGFWAEFWFEYLVGFLFGWFIFQLWAMRMHGNDWLAGLWKGGRAEFFSMITVMVGMGLVMRYVTPAVVGAQPQPDTYAFWTFGALGLMVGFVFTLPMNWWLVSIGWKHGQGHQYMLRKMRERHAMAS